MANPDCFGVWWEAIPGPAGDNCRSCTIKGDCLARFATITLPAARNRLGPMGTLPALAQKLVVDEQAVLVAMAYPETYRPRQQPVQPVQPEPASKHAEKTTTKTTTCRDGARLGKKRPTRTTRSAVGARCRPAKKKWTWGRHTFEARRARERQRHPEIARLTSGTRLKKTHKGILHRATVKKAGYEYQGELYPTLHMLTERIAGQRAGRDTVRFWGL